MMNVTPGSVSFTVVTTILFRARPRRLSCLREEVTSYKFVPASCAVRCGGGMARARCGRKRSSLKLEHLIYLLVFSHQQYGWLLDWHCCSIIHINQQWVMIDWLTCSLVAAKGKRSTDLQCCGKVWEVIIFFCFSLIFYQPIFLNIIHEWAKP